MSTILNRVRPVASAAGRAALAVVQVFAGASLATVKWIGRTIAHAARGFAWIVTHLAGWIFTGRLPEIGAKLGCVGIPAGIVSLIAVFWYWLLLDVAISSGDWPPLLWVMLATPALVVVGVLALIGAKTRPAPAAQEPAPPEVTGDQDRLARALAAAFPAIARALREDPRSLGMSRIVTDWRTGVRSVDFHLPYGVTARQVARQPELIAHALGVKADQVSMAEGDHPGLLQIDVAPESPSTKKPPVWALADKAVFDLASPLIVGEDMQGRPVSIRLFGTDERGRMTGGGMLLAGAVGSGKTNLLRLIVGSAALDPRCKVAVFDGKGDGDFATLAPALDWHRDGDTPAHRDDLRAMLAQATAHMNAVFAGTADRVPVLIVIDEAHDLFGKNDGDKDLAAATEHLVRKCRAAGIYLVCATQRATSNDLPTGLQKNLRDRVCLRVTGQESARVVLDWIDGSTPNEDPSKFGADAVGLAVVDAPGYRGRVKTAKATSAAVGKAAQRHPRTPGQLFVAQRPHETTGAPFPAYGDRPQGTGPQDPDEAPEDRTAPAETILDHLDAVWLPGWDRGIHCADLAKMLTERYPWIYAGLDVPQMNAQLRDEGLEPSKGVKVAGKSATGVYWADLQAAKGGCVEAGKPASP